MVADTSRSRYTAGTAFALALMALAAALAGPTAYALTAATPVPLVQADAPQLQPAIAGGPPFLVIYANEGTPGVRNLFRLFVDANGAPAGPATITTVLHTNERPAVAYDPDNDRYLVVFQLFDAALGDWDIVGLLLAGDGTLIDAGPVAFTALNDVHPDVTYAGDGRFVAVWQQTADLADPSDAHVLAETLVLSDGELTTANQVVLSETTTQSLPGSAFPAVAADGAGHVVAVWQHAATTAGPVDSWDWNILARVITADSTLPTDSVQTLHAPAGPQVQADIAYSPVADRFLVAFEDRSQAGNPDIRALRGQIVDNVLNAGPVLDIAVSAAADVAPAVAASLVSGDFLVAYESGSSAANHDILAAPLDGTSGPAGSPLPIVQQASLQANPAIAFSAGRYLVAWEDHRNAATAPDIYGAIVTEAIPGDTDGDGDVDVVDVIVVINAFASRPGSATWNPAADFDGDNEVSVLDVLTVVTNFGTGIG